MRSKPPGSKSKTVVEEPDYDDPVYGLSVLAYNYGTCTEFIRGLYGAGHGGHTLPATELINGLRVFGPVLDGVMDGVVHGGKHGTRLCTVRSHLRSFKLISVVIYIVGFRIGSVRSSVRGSVGLCSVRIPYRAPCISPYCAFQTLLLLRLYC